MKKKKIRSLLLTILLIGGGLIGCSNQTSTDTNSNDFSNQTSTDTDSDVIDSKGKNIAKLLLARERLDSKLLRDEVKIFEKESSTNVKHNKKINYLYGESNVVGEKMRWSNFDEYNNSFSYFNQITTSIAYTAEEGANLIDQVKSTITELDKWVEYQNNKYYLSVSANTDFLYKVNDSETSICKHYVNDIGQTVYEIYLEQETVVQRIKYIPNMRYEFSQKIKVVNNEQEKYFVADYSKGYWEVSEVDSIENRYNVMYYVMKNDICYSIYNSTTSSIPMINVMSADVKTDIFSYEYLEDRTNITVKLSGFNGIDYIEAPIDDVRYTEEEKPYPDSNATLVLKNGNTICDGQSFNNGMIDISSVILGTVVDTYIPTLKLTIYSNESDVVWNTMKSFLNENGLECKRDIDIVLNGISKVDQDSQDMINYYTINDYVLNNNESISKAIDVEINYFSALKNEYEQIKNNESVSLDDMNKIDDELTFPTLENTEIDNSQIENKQVSIDKISHTLTDTFLLDENENYHITLALMNQENNDILPVYSSNETYKYHNENQFTVEANDIEFELPNASEGTYTLISYITTSDGIRVSNYEAVKFFNVSENLEDINIEKDNDGIVNIKYSRPINYTIVYETESEISYSEFYNTIYITAFEYGKLSTNIEKLVDGNYVIITQNSSITEGKYRIGYTLDDGEKITNGYINIEYSMTKK